MDAPGWDVIIATLKSRICETAATDLKAAAEAAEIIQRLEAAAGVVQTVATKAEADGDNPWGGNYDPFAEE